MDQIAALRWVQESIAAFGGDPQHVMVFGQSAGAYDVQAILVSPAARGLFSSAAIESGAIPLAQLPNLTTRESLNAPFVELVGCGASADTLGCLRSLPVDTI